MAAEQGHVYLVDDDPDIRAHLGDLLQRLGYTVTAHPSAEHFFQQALVFSPAVLLLDMRMPGQTGLHAHQRMAEKGWHTPVVFISGESRPQEIIDALKGGAVDFLIKPFDRTQLVAALDQALERDRAIHALRARTAMVQKQYESLTDREREVFRWILRAHTNLAIGELTGIQAGTVKKHRAAVFEKFGVETTAALIELCEGVGLPA